MLDLNPQGLAAYRSSKLIQRAKLADLSTLSSATIRRAEKGGSIRLGTARRIIEALGLSVDEALRLNILKNNA